jgi:3-hydroxybutyryl-CoA dehydrogenase
MWPDGVRYNPGLPAAGYDVVAVDKTPVMIDKGSKGIEKRLADCVEKAKLSDGDKDAIMDRIKTSNKLENLADCDLIEEAIPEDLELKKLTFAKLDRICKPEIIPKSTTSFFISPLGTPQ